MDVKKRKRAWAREAGLFGSLAVAGAAITYGVAQVSGAAGWIAGGILFGLLAWTVLGEI